MSTAEPTDRPRLRSDGHPMLDGLRIFADFVTASEEASIVAFVGTSEFVPGTDRNRMLRYGPGVDATGYSSGEIVATMPWQLEALCDRLVSRGLVDAQHRPNAVSVNEYHPGQGIEFHTDNDRSGEEISILGLWSFAELVFRNGRQIEVVPFAPRTLIQMSGACRWSPWKHAIRPVTDLRYSVVFRYGQA